MAIKPTDTNFESRKEQSLKKNKVTEELNSCFFNQSFIKPKKNFEIYCSAFDEKKRAQ
jgi:hypothetical protein